MKTFPKPLTLQEEKDYLQKYQDGDMEARRILIERNLRLVAHVAKKYQNADEDSEDLISIGIIGLIKAVSTFNHSKNNRLGTYAARCIENELLMYLRRKKKTARDVSLYEPIGTDKEGNEISLLDIIETEQLDMAAKLDMEKDVHQLYQIFPQVLTKREQEILRLRYGMFGAGETTQREIAGRMGISRSYVSRIETQAIAKLRARFQEKDK